METKKYIFSLDYGNRMEEKEFIKAVLREFESNTLVGCGIFVNNNPNCLELLFFASLEKDTDIVYQIEASQSLLHKINSVEWTVSNSGIEASKEEELDYVVPKEAFTDEDNAVFRCKRHTAFNGLHYMICKIKAEGNITKNKYFSLYVNDNDLSKSYLKKAELE